jgi:predicted transcriptional regulator
MTTKTHTIEVDEATATALQTRAADRGVSVPELVAELAVLETAPLAVDAGQIAELDRRWAKIEGGEPTVTHERVVQWLETWGTPAFEPWHER